MLIDDLPLFLAAARAAPLPRQRSIRITCRRARRLKRSIGSSSGNQAEKRSTVSAATGSDVAVPPLAQRVEHVWFAPSPNRARLFPMI